MESSQKKILLTSGRSPVALDLSRQLHALGHEVYSLDTVSLQISRFSNAVKKAYVVPSPRYEPEAFASAVAYITEELKIDLVIPIYEEIFPLVKYSHYFHKNTQLFAPEYELLNELHHKYLFNQKLLKLGFQAPLTHLVYDVKELEKLDRSKTYAFKACYSRASLSLEKIEPNKALPEVKIEKHNPWIAQEWIQGKKYCTYSVALNGKLMASSVYPVGYTAEERGCIVFESIRNKKVDEWIEKFVALTYFTGQIAFDFIEDSQGDLYAIECNPRATSGLHLFNVEDKIDRAFFDENKKTIFPQGKKKKQLLIAMLLYGWKDSAVPDNTLIKFLKTLFTSSDVIFSYKDMLPFFIEPLVFCGIWAQSRGKSLSLPAFFMHDFEWNGEG